MRKITLPLFGMVTLLLAVCMTGCGGGGSNFGIIINLATSPAPTIDQGQVVTVTAAVVNDNSNKGVTWSLSGLGSLSKASTTSVTYVAPSSVTTGAKATITATSIADTTVSTSTSIQVNPPPTFASASLPSGTAGTCYGQTSTSSGVTCNGETLSAAGGTPPYTWGVIVAGLPPGLSLNASSGVISGTPTTPGTYTPKFSLTDAAGLSSSATISMTIAPPPALTVSTTSLPTAAVNLSYSATLQAAGGVAPYSWNLSSGSLPAGLQLSPSGVISGTPKATGTYSLTVQVTDSEGPSPAKANRALSIIVNSVPFSITTTALPGGTKGIAYSTTLQTKGGVGSVTWSISGSLPAGLTLDTSTGVISGTPTTAGPATSFTVQATDSNASPDTATQPLSITISATTQNALVKGQYAFSLGGYNGGVVGSFTADGNGGITIGSEDLWGASSALHLGNVAIASGTYTIGADGRGVLSYKDADNNTFTFDLALSAQSSPTGASTGGAMIETDASGDNFTGSFALQSSSGFSPAVLVGGYAFGFSGWDAGKPDVVVGSASIASGGAVSSGLLDENDGGTLQKSVAFTGTLTVSNTNGRGTVTSGASQANFVFYVISKTEWYAIAYNSTTGVVRTGTVEQQSGGPYSLASVNGTMVFQSQSTASGPVPEAEVGLLTSSGGGSASTSLDVDQGGNLTTESDTDALNFTDAGNGRFTATPQSSGAFVGYMIAPNQAFIEGTGASPSLGTFEPQSAGPFSASSLNGSFFVQSLPLVAVPPNAQPPTLSSGLVAFDGTQNLTGTIDSSHGGTSTTTELSNTYSVGSNGRVSISPAGAIMYIVSSSKIVILSAGLANSTNPLIEIAQR